MLAFSRSIFTRPSFALTAGWRIFTGLLAQPFGKGGEHSTGTGKPEILPSERGENDGINKQIIHTRKSVKRPFDKHTKTSSIVCWMAILTPFGTLCVLIPFYEPPLRPTLS